MHYLLQAAAVILLLLHHAPEHQYVPETPEHLRAYSKLGMMTP
jgi:hypothetical protein